MLLGFVSNGFGQTDFTAALDQPALLWTTGGDFSFQTPAVPDAHAGPSVAQGRINEGPYYGGPGQSAWLETTVSGPGVLSFWTRHNRNPYTAIELRIDGKTDEKRVMYGAGPFTTLTPWSRLTGVLSAGNHTVRIIYSFAEEGAGTLPVSQPTVQIDDLSVLPSMGNDLLGAVEVSTQEGWFAGGTTDFGIVNGAIAHEGTDALQATVLPADYSTNGMAPPWIRHEYTGPLTLNWWEKQVDVSGASAGWQNRQRFVPPGNHVMTWTPSGNAATFLLDEISSVPTTEIPLSESLESGARIFTQGGGSWRGMLSTAAPDGVDAAWTETPANGTSWIQTTIEGPASLGFSWTASAAFTRGTLNWSINGRLLDLPNPDMVALLPPGSHQVRWTASQYSGLPAVTLLDAVQVQPATEINLGQAADAPELTWTTSSPGWVGLASSAAPDGTDAVVAPWLEPNATAWIETQVQGPGTLHFRWPMNDAPSSRYASGGLSLWIDGRQQIAQQGVQPAPRVEVGSGLHTFRWVATGQDKLRLSLLDQVSWTPALTAAREAVDGGTGPMFLPDESLGTINSTDHHDGTDALALAQSYQSYFTVPSLSTWFEGPGHAYFWWKPATGNLLINGNPQTSYTTDGPWQRGIVYVPPGWHNIMWSVTGSQINSPPSLLVDEISFTPTATTSLDNVLTPPYPWRTSPAVPWVGIPATYILTTTPSAQASVGTPATPSWMETEFTGPAVLTFNAAGSSLKWSVDGKGIGGSTSNAISNQALYVPVGKHTVRWQNEGASASLTSLTVRAMSDQVSMRTTPDGLEFVVPRPSGLTDAKISLQYLYRESPPAWFSQFATITSSTAQSIIFRVTQPTASRRFYRVSFAP